MPVTTIAVSLIPVGCQVYSSQLTCTHHNFRVLDTTWVCFTQLRWTWPNLDMLSTSWVYLIQFWCTRQLGCTRNNLAVCDKIGCSWDNVGARHNLCVLNTIYRWLAMGQCVFFLRGLWCKNRSRKHLNELSILNSSDYFGRGMFEWSLRNYIFYIFQSIIFQSGAKINISDGSCPERIVTVTGTTECINKAFTFICKKFEEVRFVFH